MTKTHLITLAAFAVITFLSGCAFDVQTKFGKASYNGKTVTLIQE